MSRAQTTCSAFLVLLGPLVAAPAPVSAAPEVMPGQVIVRWKLPAALRAKVTTELAGRHARLVRALDAQTELLKLGERTAAATWAAVAALEHDARVEFVQPNYLRRPFLKPNDEYYALQWHVPVINAEAAWDISRGSAQVRIAVIDTGIRKDHPDFSGQLLPGYDFITDATSAGDGDGRDADPDDTGDNTASSSALHGTHVAGIIGARADNAKGIAGSCWDCKIVPVRALGIDRGRGADADIADAIRWAAGIAVNGAPANQYPAHVINMSFGGEGQSSVLTQAVQAALAKGVIVVAAAGNDAKDGAQVYPAAVPGVITVGATSKSGGRAPYSNYGAVVDVSAPGGNLLEQLPPFQGQATKAGIISTMFYKTENKYGYHLYEGTSQAAPIVAGVVGLMVAVDPGLTPAEALTYLKQTAKPLTCDKPCGAGMLDAAAAVQLAKTNAGTTTPPPTGNNRPFGTDCTQDTQCTSGVCRSVSGPSYICTQFCSNKQGCPSSADCVSGLCQPVSGPSTNPPVTNPNDSTIHGVGCAMGRRAPASRGELGLLLLGLLALVALRRRR